MTTYIVFGIIVLVLFVFSYFVNLGKAVRLLDKIAPPTPVSGMLPHPKRSPPPTVDFTQVAADMTVVLVLLSAIFVAMYSVWHFGEQILFAALVPFYLVGAGFGALFAGFTVFQIMVVWLLICILFNQKQ